MFHPEYIVNDEINWFEFSRNTSPNTTPILEQNLDKVDWRGLSWNPNAIHILEKHQNQIDFVWLSGNPNAIHLLDIHLSEDTTYKMNTVHGGVLSLNPNAIHLIAPLDRKKMRENCKVFAQELASYVFHPTRLMKICEVYGLELPDYFELV